MKTTVIYESASTLIFIRETPDAHRFIVKVLKAPNPTPRQIAHLENEFEITRSLDLPGIRKALRREQTQGKLALVFPYVPGLTLGEWIRQNADFDLEKRLHIAVQMAALLSEVHALHIIHCDFNSNNLIFDEAEQRITLIDFELANRQPVVPAETPPERRVETFEGTLAFVSPEQTGRLNLPVDHRTDLYAMGVTLYQLFTGELPFRYEDPMEMIHAHLAQQPEAPHRLRTELPATLSEIILRLMAKDPAQRYQSAPSLHADLVNCLDQWQQKGSVRPFELAMKDRRRDFNLPEKLYGRENLILLLEKSFDSVRLGTVEVSILMGETGVGKTAIAHRLRSYIQAENGYFIEGRFDQTRGDIPYQAIIQGFNGFIHILLTEDVFQLENWKRKILDALGQNGRVLTAVVPDLELIIGKQPPVPDVGPVEAQNRFIYVVRNFIRAISTQEHPLVIFLDNFQWADPASFNLLKTLALDEDNQHLWLLIARRTQEGAEIEELIARLRERNVLVQEHTLPNLSLRQVNDLICDTLFAEPDACLPLAEVLYTKTQGNPFFVRQTILHMYEEGLLRFSLASQQWEWDMEAIHRLSITDNVVDLMTGKIKRQPKSTQEILRLAACIGNHFDLDILSALCGHALGEVIPRLAPALTEGLIVAGESGYRFSHDRIRQAIYSLIPTAERSDIHLHIGRLMLKHLTGETRKSHIFELVNQWNQGLDGVNQREELVLLAELNLEAGLKANDSAAYETAIGYLRTGMDLIADYGWQNHYRINLALYTAAAQAAYLSGNLVSMERWIDKVLQQTVSVLDKIDVYEIQLQSLIARHRMAEAAEIGLRVLDQLGTRIPTRFTNIYFAWLLFKVRFALRGKSMQALIDLPEMEDPYRLATMRIVNSAGPAIFISMPRMSSLLTCKQMELCLRYGNSADAATTYVGYALTHYVSTGDIDGAYAFGETGLRLLERSEANELRAITLFLFYGNLWSMKNHSRDALDEFVRGYAAGMENGDLPGAGFCVTRYGFEAYMCGRELQQLEREMARFTNELGRNGQGSVLHYLGMGRQVAQNLIFPNEHPPYELRGDLYDEEKMIPRHQEVNDQSGISSLYFNKFLLAFLFEAHDHAAEFHNLFTQNADLVSVKLNPPYYFYYSLNELARFPEATAREQKRILATVGANQTLLLKWAGSAPMNYLHKYYLVEAELHRVIGQEAQARGYYDKAIDLARSNEYLNEEALAWKLTGKFYREQGHRFLAETYLQEAVKAYERWGAKAIVAFLNSRYPSYVDPPDRLRRSATSGSASTSSREGLHGLDLASIAKATQALSSEVVLSNLLEKMMQIVIENAGASRGVFIEARDKQLFLLAHSDAKTGTQVRKAQLIENEEHIPHTLLYYVARTRQVMAVDYAARDTRYEKDPYLQKMCPAAVLCFPIEYKNQLIGVIYLENQEVAGAFTPERIEVLNILSSQMAISIENARLYEHLDEKVRARTQQLNQKNQELARTLAQLKSAQQQLVQSEKMASLGQLTAGIAHEINNPINYVSGNINPLIRDIGEVQELLRMFNEWEEKDEAQAAFAAIKAYRDEIDADFLFEEIGMLLNGIRDGAKRTKEIVAGLRNFSRLDEEDFKLADVAEGLDSTLTLLQSRMKNRIEVHRNYGPLPPIECLPGKLNQVFMNVLTNAIQAISDKGNIYIDTRQQGKYAEIRIRDTGSGIPSAIQQRIFEPFFTTKDVGEGTGLGLSISFGIVEQHAGRIEVKSEPGEGSEFIISIPIKREP